MSIRVICPGCHKSFNVSDQFAGRSGACPKCKGKIQVPKLDEQVEVHAPTEFAEGGRTTSGKLVTKPVARHHSKVTLVGLLAIVGTILGVLLVTWLAGGLLRQSLLAQALGLAIVSPLLAITAYTFLRDAEFDPLQGRALYLRTSLCGLAYAALWGVFAFLIAPSMLGEIYEWGFVAVPFVVAGGAIALGCLDLEFGTGCFHYAFYLLMTILLRWIAGIGWIWTVVQDVAT